MSDHSRPPDTDLRIAELDKLANELPSTSPRHLLAIAERAARIGDAAKARGCLRDLRQRFHKELLGTRGLLVNALIVALIAADFDSAAAMLNDICDSGDWIAVEVADTGHAKRRHMGAVHWEIVDRSHCRMVFDRQLVLSEHARLHVGRLVIYLPLLVAYRSYNDFATGGVFINLGDVGDVPGLAFCDNRPDYYLVPDVVFVDTRGYADMRKASAENAIPWDQRMPLAYWRGGTTGRPSDPALGWRSMPRIVLCRIGEAHRDLIDAGIAHVQHRSGNGLEQELRASGLLRDYVPATEFMKYKYQIDIDGNTNSWPGLFQKLLTGSPVLKVASPLGFRQWYYDRLQPWINFVPVATDMSDLVEKIGWLAGHDDAARLIGERGQALAMSMTYESELQAAEATIAEAIRYFAVQPDMQLKSETRHRASPIDGRAARSEQGLPSLARQGKPDVSEQELRTAIAGDPANARLHDELSQLLRRAGRGDEALAELRRAVELDPARASARAYLAALLARDGALDEALHHVRAAIDTAPNVAAYRVTLGNILSQQGAREEAEGELKLAVQLDPQHAPAFSALGNLLDQQGRLDEAIIEARRAADLNRANPHPHAFLGTLLIRSGELAAAERELRVAIELDPKVARFHSSLCQVLARLNRIEEAVAAERMSLALEPQRPHARAHLGMLLLRLGDAAAAETELRLAIGLNAGVARFHSGLARALERQERTEAAVVAARQAVTLDSGNAGFHAHLAELLRLTGASVDAAAELRRAVQLAPDNPGFKQRLEQMLVPSAVGPAQPEVAAPPRLPPQPEIQSPDIGREPVAHSEPISAPRRSPQPRKRPERLARLLTSSRRLLGLDRPASE